MKFYSHHILIALLSIGVAAVLFADPFVAHAESPDQKAQNPTPPRQHLPDDPADLVRLPNVNDGIAAYLHLPPPQPPGQVKDIAISNEQVCVLIHAGLVFCWRFDGGEAIGPPNIPLATITAGARHFCGLDSTARPVCWGADDMGQLAAPNELLLQIAAGDTHTCGLDYAGEPICWGRADADHDRPPSGPFQDISAGPRHSCAIGPWESSRCWGQNAVDSTPFDEPVGHLEVSSDLVCALDMTNRPICSFGRVGEFELPSPLAADLAVGRSFVCTLEASGRLDCAGPGAPDLPNTPPISRAIDASDDVLCAITAWETLMCWDETGEVLDK